MHANSNQQRLAGSTRSQEKLMKTKKNFNKDVSAHIVSNLSVIEIGESWQCKNYA